MKAVITGSTKGIGRAVAFALAKEGWDVALTSRHAEELAHTRAELRDRYPDRSCLVHTVDFGRKKDAIAYGRTLLGTWPDIDLLVNNAGIFLPGAVHEEPDGALEAMTAVNLFGPYHLTRTLLPAMIARRSGQ